MGHVHVRAHGSVPPERFVAALTDFGPGARRSGATAIRANSSSTTAGTPGPT